MKVSAIMFSSGIFFFIPVGIVYGILTDFKELVGFPAILLAGLMSIMIGGYLFLHSRSIGRIAADSDDGEIADEAYEYGFYSPWSWWPLVIGVGAGICFFGMAVGFWIVPFGAVIALVGLVGLVFEYDRGNFAH
ncbi:cytochrome c oxidase subunit 4 [Brevibacterium sp. BRM-1]|uniref:cytochrome c oxidase subunit 4 n=1 Tax=Brevibacterium sp. BRM-1 TaxID=2999062 RepID=UPI002282D6AD|nr:cytochrome c oxidase subunit 4 [Brevibacterium sp. BRM-1]WAL40740.1 cytochrome c oxidase subunit 4 [Brevibacterium sp. BRM-1]